VPEIAITVVICTHQRADSLGRTLHGVVEQAGAGNVEVIVIDNGSTDHTAAVVDTFPSVRYVHESRIGLCHARNRGWQEARALVVAYLDDDAIPAPGWVVAIREAFAGGDSRLGCVGGPVLPDWEAPAPAWMSPDVSRALAIIDWPGERRHLTDIAAEWLAGANMACRVDVLQEVGGFHVALGRQGGRLISGEETFMQRRLIERGYVCLYEPAMTVHHRVPKSRLVQSWFRERYFWQGVSDAMMELIEDRPTALQRLRAAITYGRRLVSAPADLATLFRNVDDPRAFEQQCWTWIAVGHLAGLLGAGGR
jgi:glucosyl-dolichyl phosphate glucuronosyltransferase